MVYPAKSSAIYWSIYPDTKYIIPQAAGNLASGILRKMEIEGIVKRVATRDSSEWIKVENITQDQIDCDISPAVRRECIQCREEKDTLGFRPGKRICRKCDAKNRREKRADPQAKNKTRELRIAAYNKLDHYLIKNTPKECARCRETKEGKKFAKDIYNPDGLSAYCKKCMAIKQGHYNASNPESAMEYYRANREQIFERYALRVKNNPALRLLNNLRSRLRLCLKSQNAVKSTATIDLAGCTRTALMEHIQRKFRDGMDWHVDHIKPCKLFNMLIESEQKDCFHWSNLQPLFGLENLKKGAKYEEYARS